MTITFVKENKGIEFASLMVGDVFVEVDDPEDVYIKIDEISDTFNAVDLRRGRTVCISPNTRVELMEAELLVSR